ncbi:hypothetical protein Taro_044109 [Colocasia esculenta]|uniref:Uncharacterized protein n=1 Tax=Colocasia esculenta TaxID=4460 RepID=A0A843X223_COLES|nr:hypothetical protein [Colocasia esculenta]
MPPPPPDGEMESGTEETGCAVGVAGAFVPGTTPPPPQPWRLFAAARLLLLLVLVLGCCLGDLRSNAQRLPQEEVEALRRIAVKLRKPAEQWDFREDPCSGRGGWANVTGPKGRQRISNITCDCTFNGSTVCHVISLQLMRQNLTGVLPEEVANLMYLRFLNLENNQLQGPIPPELGESDGDYHTHEEGNEDDAQAIAKKWQESLKMSRSFWKALEGQEMT